MTDQSVLIWLIIMLVVEGAAVILMGIMSFNSQIKSLPTLMRVGLLIACFGLVIQIIRSVHYYFYGSYPVDHFFPLWVTKDIGLSIIIFHLYFKLKHRESAIIFETTINAKLDGIYNHVERIGDKQL